MGSIKVGKDVDVVLWIDYFMLVYVWVEKMIVDGIVYFDIVEDKECRLVL